MHNPVKPYICVWSTLPLTLKNCFQMHFFHFHIDHWILDCAFGCYFGVDYFSTDLKLNWFHKLHWLVRDNLRFPRTCIYSYHCSINTSAIIIIIYLIVLILMGNWLNGSGIDVNIIYKTNWFILGFIRTINIAIIIESFLHHPILTYFFVTLSTFITTGNFFMYSHAAQTHRN